jgi:8-oxo-dGTP pyrophosphatase MutT (NUDIX family)
MPAFRSCGFLVLKKSLEGTPAHFLLMKHPNRYDLPKGHQEEGETDLDTAFRELWEETGIQREMVEVLEGFSNTHVYYPKSVIS